MKRVQFEIGQGFAGDGSSISGELKLMLEDAFDYLTKAFGAYHAVKGSGAWTSERDKPAVKEPSLFITVYADRPDSDFRSAAEVLKNIFRQNTVVMVIERNLEVSFV